MSSGGYRTCAGRAHGEPGRSYVAHHDVLGLPADHDDSDYAYLLPSIDMKLEMTDGCSFASTLRER